MSTKSSSAREAVLVSLAAAALIACGETGDTTKGVWSPAVGGNGANPLGSAGTGQDMLPGAGMMPSAGTRSMPSAGTGQDTLPGAGMMPSAGTSPVPSAGAGGSPPASAGSGGTP